MSFPVRNKYRLLWLLRYRTKSITDLFIIFADELSLRMSFIFPAEFIFLPNEILKYKL